jgi:7-carboxy-7-deazaguanine synthase
MFGLNYVAPIEHGDGQMLRIVQGSPFPTLQGEGPFVGHPATFIRLHGCPLRCWFCDTKFSDPDDPTVDINELIADCVLNKYRLVVITGGEPLRQNIVPLCTKLTKYGFLVQIETAGVHWLEGLEKVAKIIVSPKTPVIHHMIRQHATAFKYVISQRDLHDGYLPITATQPKARPTRLAAPRDGAPVYLSPCDEYDEQQNKLNRELVGKLARQHDVIAGIQLHKLLNLVEPN